LPIATANWVGTPLPEGAGPWVPEAEGAAVGDGDAGGAGLVASGPSDGGNDAPPVEAGVAAAEPHDPATMTATRAAPAVRTLVALDSDRAGTRYPSRSDLANIMFLFRW
jgi:hypothetical protein